MDAPKYRITAVGIRSGRELTGRVIRITECPYERAVVTYPPNAKRNVPPVALLSVTVRTSLPPVLPCTSSRSVTGGIDDTPGAETLGVWC